MTQC